MIGPGGSGFDRSWRTVNHLERTVAAAVSPAGSPRATACCPDTSRISPICISYLAPLSALPWAGVAFPEGSETPTSTSITSEIE